MKKNLIPLILIILGILGILITVYITKQQESLDIGDSAATATQYYVVANLDNCPSGTTKNVNCFDVINSALGAATNKAYAKVTIQAGTYDLQANIGGTNTTNIEIHGEGNDKTFIKNTSNTPGKGILGNGHPFQIENPNATVLFADLTIDGTAGDSSIHIHNAKEVNAWNIRVVNSSAAGIYFDNGAKGTVNNSYFSENTWPGVSVHGSANVTIKDSKFLNHKHQGVDVKDSANVTIDGCEFSKNDIVGDEEVKGAIVFYGNSSGKISQTKLISNNKSGITIRDNSSLEIINNFFQYDGIIIRDNSQVTIKNNIIKDNVQEGIDIEDGNTVEIINNTITNNFGIDRPGGISIYRSASVEIINNIIVDNNGSGIYRSVGGDIPYTGTLTEKYNDVWNNSNGDYDGLEAGTGDISLDPKFVSATDFHLQSDSPAIDAGDPDSQYNDPDGSRNDMGAYGGQSTMCTKADDCKTPCIGNQRTAYACNANQFGFGSCDATVPQVMKCSIECGADCEQNSDCTGGKTCNTSTCKCESSCTPDCSEKECGSDGCGGSCGSCSGDKSCVNNKCISTELDCSNADVNGTDSTDPDGEVTMSDISLVLANFKWQKSSKDSKADMNGPDGQSDGEVDMRDVSKVLACFRLKKNS
jgi:parallel beta-helix repeat protein